MRERLPKLLSRRKRLRLGGLPGSPTATAWMDKGRFGIERAVDGREVSRESERGVATKTENDTSTRD